MSYHNNVIYGQIIHASSCDILSIQYTYVCFVSNTNWKCKWIDNDCNTDCQMKQFYNTNYNTDCKYTNNSIANAQHEEHESTANKQHEEYDIETPIANTDEICCE